MAKRKTKQDPRAKVSIDAGNGGVNAVLNAIMIYFASVRARVTGDSLNMQGGIGQLSIPFATWRGTRYTWGDHVLANFKPTMERHLGENRYGNEFHQFLIATALAQLGVASGVPIDLTVCIPPGYYNQGAPYMQKHLVGDLSIHLAGEKEPRTWNIETVSVWPESLAMCGAFMMDAAGETLETSLFDGETLMLDIGINTLDAVRVSDGNFNPESLETATWAQGGANEHMRKPLLRLLKKSHPDFANATVDDIDAAFRREKPIVKRGAAEVNLTDAIKGVAEEYAGWMANNILDGEYAGLSSIRHCIVGGGLASHIEPWLRKWYGDKIVDVNKHPHTRHLKNIHPGFWNAIGARNMSAYMEASE